MATHTTKKTARKDVADYLNDHALSCAETLVIIALGDWDKGEVGKYQLQIAACDKILKKVIPDLKAVEATINGKLDIITPVLPAYLTDAD